MLPATTFNPQSPANIVPYNSFGDGMEAGVLHRMPLKGYPSFEAQEGRPVVLTNLLRSGRLVDHGT